MACTQVQDDSSPGGSGGSGGMAGIGGMAAAGGNAGSGGEGGSGGMGATGGTGADGGDGGHGGAGGGPSVYPCTEQGIRDAVAAGGGPHTFDCGDGATVTTQAEITIEGDVTLDGLGKLTIDGNDDHRVFQVSAGARVELQRLTIAGGNADGGGGILNLGTLTLEQSIVAGNTAETGGGIMNSEGTLGLIGTTVSANRSTTGTDGGGGVYNHLGIVTLSDSIISDNTATSHRMDYGVGGGGIQNEDGSLSLTDTRVTNNVAADHGGGIYSSGEGIGTVTLVDCEVSGNDAPTGGGMLIADGTASLTRSLVSGNTAETSGGGIENWATLTLIETEVSGNEGGEGGGIRNAGSAELTTCTVASNTAPFGGGGLMNSRSYGGFLTLTDTEVSGNSASGGGGILNDGTLALVGSTLSANEATSYNGGGIFNFWEVAISNCTVSGNQAAGQGGGFYNHVSSAVVLTAIHTTLSGNDAPEGAAVFNNRTAELTATLIDGVCGGPEPVTSGGDNIESPGDSCSLTAAGDQPSVDPLDLQLGPLQDNGGPTQTHALLTGSVAIDQIDAPCAVDVDQRGQPRDTQCDVGAFERAQ